MQIERDFATLHRGVSDTSANVELRLVDRVARCLTVQSLLNVCALHLAMVVSRSYNYSGQSVIEHQLMHFTGMVVERLSAFQNRGMQAKTNDSTLSYLTDFTQETGNALHQIVSRMLHISEVQHRSSCYYYSISLCQLPFCCRDH